MDAIVARGGPEAVLPRLPRPRVVPRRRRGRRASPPSSIRSATSTSTSPTPRSSAAGSSTSSSPTSTRTSSPATSSCATACGARIYLGARAEAEYEFTPLADGDAVELGEVRLVALETPGHSPESISILVYDLAADAEHPHAVLTGDTLFIGDVGRPDLRASLGLERRGARVAPLRLGAGEAPAAPRRHARVPRARRRLALRQAPEQRDRLDDRRSSGSTTTPSSR